MFKIKTILFTFMLSCSFQQNYSTTDQAACLELRNKIIETLEAGLRYPDSFSEKQEQAVLLSMQMYRIMKCPERTLRAQS